ncbi:hypothetical protein MYSTI_03267 [Myxococcus stipitatus DSM 14675]|uniref:DUF4145 domain-containing protein n=1 Tax=Myxococcus stipitatus (strain DSM 14675 / JCM 12634 / Mx s8) TaxID=1278073 RepID=L7UDQ0_MYXSD|nr:hypothetical protein [Myxococcus stipitatus]AGC44579.1 hypothetical protein MYSTI_03267 [Myxococcus stipitatus DSM 14675]
MATNTQAILEDIDRTLREAENIRTKTHAYHTRGNAWTDTAPELITETLKDTGDLTRACLMLASAIARYASPNSPFRTQTNAILGTYGSSSDDAREQLSGALRGIRHEYEHGLLNSVTELIHRDVFSDFLEMAHHLAEKGFKDPAAVVAAGVLEQHLRQLAQKHTISLLKDNGENKSTEAINAELAKAGAYDLPTQKEITAKLALRNQAAHAMWDKYELRQVYIFIDWVRFFITKVPA